MVILYWVTRVLSCMFGCVYTNSFFWGGGYIYSLYLSSAFKTCKYLSLKPCDTSDTSNIFNPRRTAFALIRAGVYYIYTGLRTPLWTDTRAQDRAVHLHRTIPNLSRVSALHCTALCAVHSLTSAYAMHRTYMHIYTPPPNTPQVCMWGHTHRSAVIYTVSADYHSLSHSQSARLNPPPSGVLHQSVYRLSNTVSHPSSPPVPPPHHTTHLALTVRH